MALPTARPSHFWRVPYVSERPPGSKAAQHADQKWCGPLHHHPLGGSPSSSGLGGGGVRAQRAEGARTPEADRKQLLSRRCTLAESPSQAARLRFLHLCLPRTRQEHSP